MRAREPEVISHVTDEMLQEACRTEAEIPGVRDLDHAQLVNHTATFLVDIGLNLVTLDEGGGEPTLMRDGTEIQRVISDLHGAQRARLGWPEEAIGREFELLKEIVGRTLRENVSPNTQSGMDEALGILARLLEQAERISLRGFHRAGEHAPAGEGV